MLTNTRRIDTQFLGPVAEKIGRHSRRAEESDYGRFRFEKIGDRIDEELKQFRRIVK
jgi:hypothetical protein